METIRIGIAGRIAKNLTPEIEIVCGNSGYQIQFEFDEEWDAYAGATKTARFTDNGVYTDVEFVGDTCDVPVMSRKTVVSVGVFVGEQPDGGNLISSTTANIKCKQSVRCVSRTADAGTGKNYTNEAKGYAASA